MREILFKGKKVNGGEWVEGWYCENNCEHPFAPARYDPSIIDSEFVIWYKVNPETVCQFTGKTDKNGVKMWENDIVKGLLLFGTGINGVVAFKDGSFGLKWHRGGAEMFTPFAELCNITYEVVGNIFDNPELRDEGAE